MAISLLASTQTNSRRFFKSTGLVGFPFPVQCLDIPVREFDKERFPLLGAERITRHPSAPPMRIGCQRFIEQGLDYRDLAIDSFNSASCLPYIIGEIHGFGFFDKFPYGGLPIALTHFLATTKVNKIARLSASKGSLEQKIDFAAAYRKGYYTRAHPLFLRINSNAGLRHVEFCHSIVQLPLHGII